MNIATQIWTARPRWVLTRPLRTVKPMNTDRIVVRGAQRYSPGASLYSVAFHGETRPRVWQTLWYLAAPKHRLVPRDVVFAGMSDNEFENTGHEVTRVARLSAVYAATRWLGAAPRPQGRGAVVTGFELEGPCDGLLAVGDVIVAVDGAPLSLAAQAARAVQDAAGTSVRLSVLRAQDAAGGGGLSIVEIPLPVADGARAPLGLKLATHRLELDPVIDVELIQDPDCSGPSAGLVSALSVIDVLTPGRLTGGLLVAATGTVDPYGTVGEVAGIGMKALAAHRTGMDFLLVPRGARPEALGALPAGSAVKVIEVATLDAAIEALVSLGGDRPRLSQPSYALAHSG